MSKPSANFYRPLLAAAVRGTDGLRAADKADVFEGIAALSRRFDPEMSHDAQTLATSLRTAEGLQLHFQNLFTDKS